MTELPEDEEFINVRLLKDDYVIMKEMIQERKTMTRIWRWISSFLFVAVGGALSIYALIELIRNSG